MRWLLAGMAVVAFAGTAKLMATSINPGTAIRGVLVRLIRQFSQSGISWGKAIVLKIGIRGDVRNGAGNGLSQIEQSNAPFTNESRFRQTLSDVPGSRCRTLSGKDKRLVGAKLDAYLANIAAE